MQRGRLTLLGLALIAGGMLAVAGALHAQDAPSRGRSYPIDLEGRPIPEATASPTATPTAPPTTAPTGTPVPGGAAPAAPTPQPTPAVTSGTLTLLTTLETSHGAVRSYHARFHQTRLDPVFEDRVESDGELWFRKPAHFRCDYADPEKVINLIAGNEFYLYVPGLKQADYYKFQSEAERDQQLHLLTIGLGFKARELIERYEIQTSVDAADALASQGVAREDMARWVVAAVRPRAPYAETSPFRRLRIFLHKTRLLPEKIWYEDPSGAEITLVLQQVELDVPIEDAVFDPQRVMAPGTEIVPRR